jgi:transcriptional regulator with XRE-family HTH domain
MKTKLSVDVDSIVGQRIREHRKKLGMTQSDVAKKLGVSFQQFQKCEKGVNRIGAGRLFEIACLLGIPIQALFPSTPESTAGAKNRAQELEAISEFMASVDGWKLCRAFLKVDDPHKREVIVALVQGISES